MSCLKAQCEELKLRAEKSEQTVKNLTAKLRRTEQEPTPSERHEADIKKLEATCSKLRAELADERTEKGNVLEKLAKMEEVSCVFYTLGFMRS